MNALDKRNQAIAAIKEKYWLKRERLLLECQWEIDEAQREYLRSLRPTRKAA